MPLPTLRGTAHDLNRRRRPRRTVRGRCRAPGPDRFNGVAVDALDEGPGLPRHESEGGGRYSVYPDPQPVGCVRVGDGECFGAARVRRGISAGEVDQDGGGRGGGANGDHADANGIEDGSSHM